MDSRTDGDVLQRKSIANFDIRLWTGFDHVADLQTIRRKNVTLLAVHIVEKSDACTAVWIVFDRSNARRNAVLRALEVNHTIKALMTAALMTYGETTLLIAAAVLFETFRQRLFRFICRNLVERCNRHKTASGGVRFETFYCHLMFPPLPIKLRRTRCFHRQRASQWLSCNLGACRKCGPCASSCREH